MFSHPQSTCLFILWLVVDLTSLLLVASQKMAVNSFRLFTQQVEKARGPMQVNSLKIVFDLLMVYPTDYLTITDENGVGSPNT